MLVLAQFGLSLSLGSPLGISNAQSSYWLVLSARFTWALAQDHTANHPHGSGIRPPRDLQRNSTSDT